MAPRPTTGFVESLLLLIDLDWTVPDFSTLSRRQKSFKVNIPYRGSQSPLHLLIDSTGIKAEGEGKSRKHRGTKRRIWRKIHIGIDEKTLEIRAAELTSSNIGDAPMLPALLDQIPSTKRSPASPPTALSTRARATMPSLPVALPQSFRLARTPALESRQRRGDGAQRSSACITPL